MFTKVLVFTAFVIVCNAGVIHVPSGDNKDYYAYPQYKFSYGVADPATGDNKSQFEERNGDAVKGVYTVADPDGTLRTVHYTADDRSGFNAFVDRKGQAAHPAVYTRQSEKYDSFSHH